MTLPHPHGLLFPIWSPLVKSYKCMYGDPPGKLVPHISSFNVTKCHQQWQRSSGTYDLLLVIVSMDLCHTVSETNGNNGQKVQIFSYPYPHSTENVHAIKRLQHHTHRRPFTNYILNGPHCRTSVNKCIYNMYKVPVLKRTVLIMWPNRYDSFCY